MASITPEFGLFERILQTLAIIALLMTQVASFLVIPAITYYIIIHTRFWWICLLYIGWYLTLDKDAPITGKRRSEWVRSWSWWYYAKNYYPVKVFKAHSEKLDPKRNYLFCYFPHGLLATSSFMTIATNATEFKKLFPDHTPYLHTISAFYKIPLLRELGIKLGGVNANKEALETILGKKDGGNISALVVGGAQEAYYSNPGIHKIFLKKRKGFIKIALRKGAPLVPVYNFGENEIFSQLECDEKSIYQQFREMVRKKLGFCLIRPIGRKDMLGLVPRRKPLNVVFGEPIDVKQTENPTQEQIDNLHHLFEKKIVELFESQKQYYLEDYKNVQLEVI